MRRLIWAALLLSLAAVAANADWNPGDPYKMHFPQLPDLSPTGVDVDLGQKMLGDDWLCTESGPVSAIHIWTSFFQDQVPPGGPGAVPVTLSIYSDVPAGPTTQFSHPGNLLWSQFFAPLTYKARLYAPTPNGEWWYDPMTGVSMFPGDFNCYQWNFNIPQASAFVQQKGTMYWLVAQADVPPMQVGWKSSLNHFMDDAAFAPIGTVAWRDLHYASNHPMAGQSMDLAFVIAPEPGSLAAIGTGVMGLLGMALRRRRN